MADESDAAFFIRITPSYTRAAVMPRAVIFPSMPGYFRLGVIEISLQLRQERLG